MKDDYGNKWNKKDYIVAVMFLIGILIIICVPAGTLLLFDILTNYKYHWYAWILIFIGIFIFNTWMIFRKKG